ncbi:MAG: hypothetical protein P4M14_01815 [Gammaproteobacteria bacterium]|nr:hypothetical protein [Gammaproteobacteria bacterium]
MPNSQNKKVAADALGETYLDVLDDNQAEVSQADEEKTTTEYAAEEDGSQTLLVKNSKGEVIQRKKNHYWQKTVDGLNVAAEVSNFGIFFQVVSAWLPFIQAMGAGVIGMMAAFTDPMIYFFRSLIRVTRVVGREFFGITLDDEENGAHKHQTAADIASMILFSIAIPLFFGLIIASPVGITVAWGLAISGLGVAGYFDYAYPARMAKEKYENLKNDENANPQDVANALKDFEIKQTAKRFFFSLIFSVGLLVICTSAAVFAPPMIVPALFILSKVASALLGLIAVGRFVNSRRSKEAEMKAAAEADNAERLTEEATLNSTPDLQKTSDNKLTSSAQIAKSVSALTPAISRHADLATEKSSASQPVVGAVSKGKKTGRFFFNDAMPVTQQAAAAPANDAAIANRPQ